MSEKSHEATQSYESATARLEEIIQRLDSGDAQLRETLELCEEAKTLIEYCAGELAAVDRGLKELKLEDLASSLTASSEEPTTQVEATGSASPAPAEEPPPPSAPPGYSDVPF